MTVDTLSMEVGGLVVKTTRDGTKLAAVFSGVAELPAVDRLHTLLKDLHADALATPVTEVYADLTQLEFMNSSCFKSFVTWIIEIQEQPTDKQYKVRIRSNEQILWQRRSMHALKSLAADLIQIEV